MLSFVAGARPHQTRVVSCRCHLPGVRDGVALWLHPVQQTCQLKALAVRRQHSVAKRRFRDVARRIVHVTFADRHRMQVNRSEILRTHDGKAHTDWDISVRDFRARPGWWSVPPRRRFTTCRSRSATKSDSRRSKGESLTTSDENISRTRATRRARALRDEVPRRAATAAARDAGPARSRGIRSRAAKSH